MKESASPPSSLYEVSIEHGKIREFAMATRSSNPSYYGPAAVITPTFLTTAHNFWEPADQDRLLGLGLDIRRVLHAEETYIFHGPLPKAGQILTVISRLGEQHEKEGKRGGRMRFVVVVTEFRDNAGALVAEKHTTVVETAERRGKGVRQ